MRQQRGLHDESWLRHKLADPQSFRGYYFRTPLLVGFSQSLRLHLTARSAVCTVHSERPCTHPPCACSPCGGGKGAGRREVPRVGIMEPKQVFLDNAPMPSLSGGHPSLRSRAATSQRSPATMTGEIRLPLRKSVEEWSCAEVERKWVW